MSTAPVRPKPQIQVLRLNKSKDSTKAQAVKKEKPNPKGKARPKTSGFPSPKATGVAKPYRAVGVTKGTWVSSSNPNAGHITLDGVRIKSFIRPHVFKKFQSLLTNPECYFLCYPRCNPTGLELKRLDVIAIATDLTDETFNLKPGEFEVVGKVSVVTKTFVRVQLYRNIKVRQNRRSLPPNRPFSISILRSSIPLGNYMTPGELWEFKLTLEGNTFSWVCGEKLIESDKKRKSKPPENKVVLPKGLMPKKVKPKTPKDSKPVKKTYRFNPL
jgi:hypothetical protein